jgi:hypothetical protein
VRALSQLTPDSGEREDFASGTQCPYQNVLHADLRWRGRASCLHARSDPRPRHHHPANLGEVV